jgi:hypothetical protein
MLIIQVAVVWSLFFGATEELFSSSCFTGRGIGRPLVSRQPRRQGPAGALQSGQGICAGPLQQWQWRVRFHVWQERRSPCRLAAVLLAGQHRSSAQGGGPISGGMGDLSVCVSTGIELFDLFRQVTVRHPLSRPGGRRSARRRRPARLNKELLLLL